MVNSPQSASAQLGPMSNLGLPYILKHYIDIITQPGLA